MEVKQSSLLLSLPFEIRLAIYSLNFNDPSIVVRTHIITTKSGYLSWVPESQAEFPTNLLGLCRSARDDSLTVLKKGITLRIVGSVCHTKESDVRNIAESIPRQWHEFITKLSLQHVPPKFYYYDYFKNIKHVRLEPTWYCGLPERHTSKELVANHIRDFYLSQEVGSDIEPHSKSSGDTDRTYANIVDRQLVLWCLQDRPPKSEGWVVKLDATNFDLLSVEVATFTLKEHVQIMIKSLVLGIDIEKVRSLEGDSQSWTVEVHPDTD